MTMKYAEKHKNAKAKIITQAKAFKFLDLLANLEPYQMNLEN